MGGIARVDGGQGVITAATDREQPEARPDPKAATTSSPPPKTAWVGQPQTARPAPPAAPATAVEALKAKYSAALEEGIKLQAAARAKLGSVGQSLETWSNGVIADDRAVQSQMSKELSHWDPRLAVHYMGGDVLQGAVGLVGLAGQAMQPGAGDKLANAVSHPLDTIGSIVGGMAGNVADAYKEGGAFAAAGRLANVALGAKGLVSTGAKVVTGVLGEEAALDAGVAARAAAQNLVRHNAGETLNNYASRLIAEANKRGPGSVVNGEVYGTRLVARAGDDVATVTAPYAERVAKANAAGEAAAAEAANARAAKLADFEKRGVKISDEIPKGFKLSGEPRPPNSYNNSNSRPLALITERQLRSLPEGTRLTAIDGQTAVVGLDTISLDTRGGLLAYGFLLPQ